MLRTSFVAFCLLGAHAQPVQPVTRAASVVPVDHCSALPNYNNATNTAGPWKIRVDGCSNGSSQGCRMEGFVAGSDVTRSADEKGIEKGAVSVSVCQPASPERSAQLRSIMLTSFLCRSPLLTPVTRIYFSAATAHSAPSKHTSPPERAHRIGMPLESPRTLIRHRWNGASEHTTPSPCRLTESMWAGHRLKGSSWGRRDGRRGRCSIPGLD